MRNLCGEAPRSKWRCVGHLECRVCAGEHGGRKACQSPREQLEHVAVKLAEKAASASFALCSTAELEGISECVECVEWLESMESMGTWCVCSTVGEEQCTQCVADVPALGASTPTSTSSSSLCSLSDSRSFEAKWLQKLVQHWEYHELMEIKCIEISMYHRMRRSVAPAWVLIEGEHFRRLAGIVGGYRIVWPRMLHFQKHTIFPIF